MDEKFYEKGVYMNKKTILFGLALLLLTATMGFSQSDSSNGVTISALNGNDAWALTGINNNAFTVNVRFTVTLTSGKSYTYSERIFPNRDNGYRMTFGYNTGTVRSIRINSVSKS